MMLKFKKAKVKDAKILIEIQIKAFKYDLETCGSGPPGYNSEVIQESNIKKYNYFKIVENQITIGGFYYTVQNRKCELIRLYILPDYQKMGIGSKVLNFLEQVPNIDFIELEASDFNLKNHEYYENRGFQKYKIKYYTSISYSIVFRKYIKKKILKKYH